MDGPGELETGTAYPAPAASASGAWLLTELRRLALAFLAYLALFPLWRASGLFDLYAAVVLASAGAIARGLGALGPGERVAPDALPNLESALVFVVALALVASRLSLGRRLWRYGALLFAILALNIACLVIDVVVAAARPSFPVQGGSMRMPAAYVALEIPHFALHVGALKAWPFIAAALTVAWNADRGRGAGDALSTPAGTPPPAAPAPPSPPRTG
jgi:hypothetical protein